MTTNFLWCCMFLPILASGADSIGLVRPQSQVAEDAGWVDVLVARCGDGVGAVTADVLATPGSAVLGVDYTAPQPAALSWASGDLTPRVVRLPILATAGFQYQRDLTLTLANPVGATLSLTSTSVNLTITDVDADPAGTLVILADDPQGSIATRDDAGTLHLQVLRSGGVQGPQSLTFTLQDEDTQVGTDYTAPATTTLHWADGVGGLQSLDLDILPRSQALGTRTLFAGWSSGSSIPVGDGWTIAITDHLQPTHGVLAVPASLTVREDAGAAHLTVHRTGASNGAVSVDWAIIDDPFPSWDDAAQAGVNYGGPTSGTLSWSAGDGSDQHLVIPLIDDGVDHPTLTSYVVFSNPTGGLIIPDSPVTAFVQPGQTGTDLHITDADHHGLIGFTTAGATVADGAGTVNLVVTRTGGGHGAVSVDWNTGNGDAMAGSDYTAGSGTLSWGAGDSSSRTVTITILNRAGWQADRWFGIYLQNAQGGAGVDGGSTGHAAATMTIHDAGGLATDSIALTASSIAVHESAGSVTVGFARSGTGLGPASVQIIMTAGTAVPVVQYGSPSTSNLAWADGELGIKSIVIPILTDGLVRPTTDFQVTSGVVYGNAVGATPASTRVAILDDDGAGTTTDAASSSGCGAGAAGILIFSLLSCSRLRRPMRLG